MCVKFGDIYYAYLHNGDYQFVHHQCVQTGLRPVLIAQNDVGNKYSPTVTVIPLTGKRKATYMPTHVVIDDYSECGLAHRSVLMIEQIQTINKDCVRSYVGTLPKKYFPAIAKAMNTQCPFS